LQLRELSRPSDEGSQRRTLRHEGPRETRHRARAVGIVQLQPVAPERLGQLTRALRPLAGFLGQALQDDRFQFLVDRRSQRPR
jgi:hypothetical protein